jgi:hypothetical protein
LALSHALSHFPSPQLAAAQQSGAVPSEVQLPASHTPPVLHASAGTQLAPSTAAMNSHAPAAVQMSVVQGLPSLHTPLPPPPVH